MGAVSVDRPHAHLLDEFERRVERVEVQKIRGLRHVKDPRMLRQGELVHGESVKVIASFDGEPVDHIQVQAVVDIFGEIDKTRPIGSEEPLVSGCGQHIHGQIVEVYFDRPDPLRPVHNKEAPATVRQLAERAKVDSSPSRVTDRSEEHTSELQSLAYLVCRLLLEKKKKQK